MNWQVVTDTSSGCVVFFGLTCNRFAWSWAFVMIFFNQARQWVCLAVGWVACSCQLSPWQMMIFGIERIKRHLITVRYFAKVRPNHVKTTGRLRFGELTNGLQRAPLETWSSRLHGLSTNMAAVPRDCGGVTSSENYEYGTSSNRRSSKHTRPSGTCIIMRFSSIRNDTGMRPTTLSYYVASKRK